MIDDTYTLEFNDDYSVFEFDSIGIKGIIRKQVQYLLIGAENCYNLGFGDKNNFTNDIDDMVITNNGDGQKVLATVAKTLIHFFNFHNDSIVIASGSTPSRTRLYRIGISKNIAGISDQFDVFGLLNDAWYPFQSNTSYEAFMICRKSH